MADPASLKFCRLICGDPVGDSDIAVILSHLSNTLRVICDELPPPFGTKEALSPLFTPFLARSLLEVSLTAMVARTDPFRVLAIAGAQTHATYDSGGSIQLAFRWQGDVLADEKMSSWGPKLKPDQVSRALLGDYQDQLLWRPTFKRFLDSANQIPSPKEWTADLLNTSEKSFLPTFRSLASTIFSKASKGIHHEFVIPINSYYDEASLQDLIDDSIRTVSCLAAVLSFCEHISFRISTADSLQIFEEIQP